MLPFHVYLLSVIIDGAINIYNPLVLFVGTLFIHLLVLTHSFHSQSYIANFVYLYKSAFLHPLSLSFTQSVTHSLSLPPSLPPSLPLSLPLSLPPSPLSLSPSLPPPALLRSTLVFDRERHVFLHYDSSSPNNQIPARQCATSLNSFLVGQ